MPDVRNIIVQTARRYGVDPAAVLAVAGGEGGLVNRPNDIGDQGGGGSYGPFQLYAQGELPSRFRGNPRAADAWAWSPQGVDYAIGRMAQSGARGLHGPQAVKTIISRFERPANIPASIANALRRLGATGAMPSGMGQAGMRPPVQPKQGGGGLDPLLASVYQQNAQSLGASVSPLMLEALLASPKQKQPPLGQSLAGKPAQPQIRPGSLDQMLTQLGVADAVTSGNRPGAITARGGVSDHARNWARDINPADKQFSQLVAYAKANPGQFKDFIYSELPWFIDEGKLYPISQLNAIDRRNHGGHAHVSRRGG